MSELVVSFEPEIDPGVPGRPSRTAPVLLRVLAALVALDTAVGLAALLVAPALLSQEGILVEYAASALVGFGLAAGLVVLARMVRRGSARGRYLAFGASGYFVVETVYTGMSYLGMFWRMSDTLGRPSALLTLVVPWLVTSVPRAVLAGFLFRALAARDRVSTPSRAGTDPDEPVPDGPT